MADVQILAAQTTSAPEAYTVPNSQEIIPKAVSAIFDGTGASGSFVAVCEIISDAGIVVAQAKSDTIAAGGSAEVSWFPGVGLTSTGTATEQPFIGALIRAGATGQNIPNNTDTDLTYASVEYDTDSMANLGSNNRILTVNTAGYYLVQCAATWGYNNSGRRLILIFKNDYVSNPLAQSKIGDTRMEPWDPFPGEGVGGSANNACARILHASVGDFFSTGVFQNSGATITVNSGPQPGAFLSASLIGT